MTVAGILDMVESESNWQVTPNEMLSRFVADSLHEKGLIGSSQEDAVLKKLRTGKASESDWLAWAEDSLARGGGEKHASAED